MTRNGICRFKVGLGKHAYTETWETSESDDSLVLFQMSLDEITPGKAFQFKTYFIQKIKIHLKRMLLSTESKSDIDPV
jgi:hypothetical protein